jgi:hypothetical protein
MNQGVCDIEKSSAAWIHGKSRVRVVLDDPEAGALLPNLNEIVTFPGINISFFAAELLVKMSKLILLPSRFVRLLNTTKLRLIHITAIY